MLRFSRKIAPYFSLFPLSVFVIFAFWEGKPDYERFKTAFTLGGILAGIQLVWTMAGRSIINRVVLGVNLYLLAGALSFYLNWPELGRAYDNLRETGVVLSIFIIGVVTTAASPYDFIGQGGPRARVIRLSVFMLIVSAIGCAVSFYFQGNLLLSAAVPIVAVQVAQRVFSRL